MKIAKKKSPSPFLIKLLLTIGLLVYLPMLIVQLAIVYSSYHTLSRQNSQYYYLETQNLSGRFYSQLSVFRTTALKISTAYPSDIKKCLNPDSPSSAFLNASKELSSYLVSTPLAQNIGVYFIEQQIFLDDAYYYKLDNFCSRFSEDDETVYKRVYDLFTQPF